MRYSSCRPLASTYFVNALLCFDESDLICQMAYQKDTFFYVVAFILGSSGEFVAVYAGAWEYSKPFYLIPVWLPFAWSISALFMKNISEIILRIISK